MAEGVLQEVEKNPTERPYIDQAIQLGHTPENLIPHLQRGLEKNIQSYEEQVRNVPDLAMAFVYASMEMERREGLRILKKEGFYAYLGSL